MKNHFENCMKFLDRVKYSPRSFKSNCNSVCNKTKVKSEFNFHSLDSEKEFRNIHSHIMFWLDISGKSKENHILAKNQLKFPDSLNTGKIFFINFCKKRGEYRSNSYSSQNLVEPNTNFTRAAYVLALTYFIPFHPPWKFQKTRRFKIFSGGIETIGMK